MPCTNTLVPALDWSGWRTAGGDLPLIDVRSPSEFARGAVPRATSAPLLDDGERAAVGTLYKQAGRIEATQEGLSLFAAKAARYAAAIDELAAPDGELFVHCWRGGMRSQMTALWLKAQGFRPTVVAGGYKAYRRTVLDALAAFAARELLVLDGRTGAGKSALLKALAPELPVIDFEGIARHRGSAFGDFAQAEPVPTQQSFENQLVERYLQVSPAAPVILVEIENFIGPLALPQALRDRVAAAPTVLLEREFDDRVERLAAEYARGWTAAEDARFRERCELLRRHVSGPDLQAIIRAVEVRDFRAATALLLRLRYDKVYDKGIARRQHGVVAKFNLTHEEDAARRFLRAYVNRSSRTAAPA